jgi:hypothetical membrane protein
MTNGMKTKFLLNLGTTLAIIFWVGSSIAGIVHGNYDPLDNTISELGKIGTKSHLFMTAVMYLDGICGVLFIVGLVMACRQFRLNIIPAIMAISMPFTALWTTYFSLPSPMHAATGPVFFLLYIGIILSFFVWRGEKLKTVRILSAVSLVLLLGIFLRFTSFIYGHEGLIQRFVYAGWSVWCITLNVQFVKMLNEKYQVK